MKVWCVWSESGEYEQFSRDLCGIFATRELAESHADQLRRQDGPDGVVEVVEDEVLSDLPVAVPYVRYAAHIWPDGTEDKGPGYHRRAEFQTWSNVLQPLDQARTDHWNRQQKPKDLYIEVIGSDEALVAAEYDRRLADVRGRMPER